MRKKPEHKRVCNKNALTNSNQQSYKIGEMPREGKLCRGNETLLRKVGSLLLIAMRNLQSNEAWFE